MLNYLLVFTTIIFGITESKPGILETIPLQQQSEQIIGLRKIYYENRPVIGYQTEILKPDLRQLAEPLRIINQARLLNPSGSIQLIQPTVSQGNFEESNVQIQRQPQRPTPENLDLSSSALTAVASSSSASAYGNAIQRYSSEVPQYASAASSASAAASSVSLSRSDNTLQNLYTLRANARVSSDPRLERLNYDDLSTNKEYPYYYNSNIGLQNNAN